MTQSTTIEGTVEQSFSLNELINMKDTLQKVFESKLPIRVSFRLSKLLNKVNSEFETFERMRFELFKRYGEEAENNQMMIKAEYVEIFTQEMTELLNQQILISFVPLSIDDLDGRVELSPIDVSRLEKILAE